MHARYPLESQLRMLASLNGTFVIGTLDCCREPLTLALRESNASKGGDGKVDQQEVMEDIEDL